MVRQCLAIDIGGTKLAAALVEVDGSISARRQVPTPHTHDAEALFATLCALADDVASRGAPNVVGVGCGGPMSPGGETVSPLNIGAWRAFRLRARLSAHLGLPVFVDNDAKALARAEGWLGAAADVDNFIAIVVSTGVGGGIVLDGRLLEGLHANAGHIGHVVVDPDGHPCVCGAVGCLEAEASGSAIEKITGRPAAEADGATIERCGTMVGRGVAAVVSLLDLNLAVVAGSVALGFGPPFFAAANAELERRACLEFARGARVEAAGLGADGPLIGAAAVGFAVMAP